MTVHVYSLIMQTSNYADIIVYGINVRQMSHALKNITALMIWSCSL